ncbi:cytochrome b561 domain-containing protein At2g30890-like isoform X2 [Rhododendron vialii]|uniref:cytochrome b561 domain-containing protein At2g30890-like isoform X2 n=1 Tax=Rhododendron vialii TaxID=182163 RepID=UPI00265E95B8|nr:cytochrome b561 domain-containing protein At2g30890-like isoform X2 [Rhododendron vialii]
MIKKLAYSTAPTNLIFLTLPLVGCSPHEQLNKASSHSIKQNNHKMTSEMTVHGLLLWASMGLLMPLGILTIRMSNREKCRRWFKLLFYMHVILQTVSVLLATAGAVLSIKSFENSFNNHHQRIGLALYAAILLQAFIGFRRPHRKSKGRSLWYFAHWVLGTTISLVGIFNIYTGLEAFHKRTSRSTRLWTILFTAQIFFMAFLYLFQDKWDYIQKQGIVLGNEAISPSDQTIPPPQENQKESNFEPSTKSNSLGSYFSKSNALKKLFQLT